MESVRRIDQISISTVKLAEPFKRKVYNSRRKLIGNLLSMSKSLGYKVPDRIKANVAVKPKKSRLKDMNIMAFTGTFQANFLIPDYLGIGKFVSRGFGAVKGQNLKNVSTGYL